MSCSLASEGVKTGKQSMQPGKGKSNHLPLITLPCPHVTDCRIAVPSPSPTLRCEGRSEEGTRQAEAGAAGTFSAVLTAHAPPTDGMGARGCSPFLLVRPFENDGREASRLTRSQRGSWMRWMWGERDTGLLSVL